MKDKLWSIIPDKKKGNTAEEKGWNKCRSLIIRRFNKL